jgi:hypothetical protein
MNGDLAMSSKSGEAPEPTTDRSALRRRLVVPELWASLAIVVMWLVVLLDALFGPDIVASTAGGDHTRVPSVVIVVFFAFLGTWVVARHGFGRRPD